MPGEGGDPDDGAPAQVDFREFAEESLELLCVSTPGGRFQWINRAWTQTLGFQREDLLAHPFLDFVHPDDMEPTSTEVAKLVTLGRPTVRFLNRVHNVVGEWRWLDWVAWTRPDGLIYASARDVTLRRQTLRESRQRVESLRLAEELGKVGHWRLDVRTQELSWSEQVHRIHGMDPGAGRPTLAASLDVYLDQDREKMAAHLERAITTRVGFEFEVRLRRPDGELRRVNTVGRPEVDPTTGDVVAVFGVFQDITDLTGLQQRLAHAEKMASVGTLAAGVAHEINNPLSYIQANAQTLEEELARLQIQGPPESVREIHEMIHEILDGTRRIHRIVHGLKTFSRTSEGRIELVELPRVLEMSSRLCMNELRHRAHFMLDAAPDTPLVAADESQLVQVAVNLIVNAMQAIEAGDRDAHAIRVACGPEGVEHAFLEVEDTGTGMSEDVLREAFSPFFTTKPQGQGTGLGLSICHGIITRAGGRMDAHSEPGVGTRMRVVLPAANVAVYPSRSTSPQSGASPDSSPAQARILVVDDDRTVARAVARLLRPHHVEIEFDPRAALSRLAADAAFDAVLCDLMMPTMSGVAFHAELRERHPELARRLIVVTGGAFSAEAQAFLESSEVPVVEKPIDLVALRRSLTAVLQTG